MVFKTQEIDICKIITPYGLNLFAELLPDVQIPFFQEVKKKSKQFEIIIANALEGDVKKRIGNSMPVCLEEYGIILNASIASEKIKEGMKKICCLAVSDINLKSSQITKAINVFSTRELDYLLWFFLDQFEVDYNLVVEKSDRLCKGNRTIRLTNNSIRKNIPVSRKAAETLRKICSERMMPRNTLLHEAWNFKINIYNINEFGSKNSSTIEDANKYVVNMIFNENSIHMLNNGNPFKYKSYLKKLEIYEENIRKKGYRLEDFVIDSSGILGLYGVRKPTDINYLSTAVVAKEANYKFIRSHMHVINTYEKMAEQIVMSPENYLYFENIKFTSADATRIACENRKELSKRIDGIFLSYITRKERLECEDYCFLLFLKVIHFVIRTKREVKKRVNLTKM